jgi:hypothetical protein
MNQPLVPALFKRLLVVLDPSSHGGPSLAAAASLAARLSAELEVLFVEDTDLLSLAEMPAARQVREAAGLGMGASGAELEASVVALARQLRREAQALAVELSLGCTFRSTRASLRSEMLAAAEAADLVILERTARPFGHLRLKGPAFLAAESMARPLLVLSDNFAIEQGVSVLVCGAGEDRAIAAGAKLAAAVGAVLQVRVLAAPEERLALEAHAHDVLSALAPDLRRRITVLEQGLAALLRSFSEGLLVLDWGNPQLAMHDGWKLAGEARCSLLIVR